MPEKQLNVWIAEDLRNYVAQRAEQEKCGMNKIIAELVQRDMAQRSGEIVERNSLVVVRELVAAELRQAHAQLRRDLRDDREQEADSLREFVRKQADRLAGLIVMAVRSSGITRRLTYAVLSKAYGTSFAMAAYEDAKEKANQELIPKKDASTHMPPEDAQES